METKTKYWYLRVNGKVISDSGTASFNDLFWQGFGIAKYLDCEFINTSSASIHSKWQNKKGDIVILHYVIK